MRLHQLQGQPHEELMGAFVERKRTQRYLRRLPKKMYLPATVATSATPLEAARVCRDVPRHPVAQEAHNFTNNIAEERGD